MTRSPGMDATDRALLEQTVRDALTAHVATADDLPADDLPAEDRSADDALAQLGWFEMLDAEPRDAVDIVCTALGTTNATAGVLDDIVAAALGIAPRDDLAVVLPEFTSARCPAPGRDAAATGLATVRARTAAALVVVRDTGDGCTAVTVPATNATIAPLHGIDPTLGLCAVRIEVLDVGDACSLAPDAWDTAVAAGRRATAHQLVGTGRTMLDLARTHALEREQFGRPIARFQAVRHRLAESLVAIEATEAALGAAWDEPGPLTAALAKGIAGRGSRIVATHCQQVLAGIGFTTDHPFHRFLKRGLALEGLFGSVEEIAFELGTHLLATRTVPTLIEL